MKKLNIAVIGGGNMGSAIIGGLSGNYSVFVCEQDKKRCRYLMRKFGVAIGDLDYVIKSARIIILAVKPRDFEKVLKPLRERITKDKIIISIAAGITCSYIEKRLGKGIRVIRTMPNLPAQVGKGITAISGGKFAKKVDVLLAKTIFDNIGKSVIVEEKWMDAVTAVSGSGPAYVFLFMEYFQKAARSLGLNDQLSKELTRETLRGSLNLFEQKKQDAAILRAQVTSKGGTTQAAINVFMENQFDKIFQQALSAAKKRARELAK